MTQRIASVALISGWLMAAAIASGEPGLGSMAPYEVTDLAGKPQSLAAAKGAKGVVLFFLGTECPVSNGYSPELARIVSGYEAKGITFLGLYPDPDLSADDARKHAKEYQLPFPVALDGTLTLAKSAGAKTVLSCVVIRPEGTILYRGRIDDRYTDDGKRRDVARTFDLRDTLDLLVAGKPVAPRQTKAFGCPIDFK
jgi:peroxiredoxin